MASLIGSLLSLFIIALINAAVIFARDEEFVKSLIITLSLVGASINATTQVLRMLP